MIYLRKGYFWTNTSRANLAILIALLRFFNLNEDFPSLKHTFKAQLNIYAPLWHLNQRKFRIIIKQIDAGTAPSKGAIWDEFCEKHQYQIINKTTKFNAQLVLFFGANKVQILCTF